MDGRELWGEHLGHQLPCSCPVGWGCHPQLSWMLPYLCCPPSSWGANPSQLAAQPRTPLLQPFRYLVDLSLQAIPASTFFANLIHHAVAAVEEKQRFTPYWLDCSLAVQRLLQPQQRGTPLYQPLPFALPMQGMDQIL
jgi:hypothetical protein